MEKLSNYYVQYTTERNGKMTKHLKIYDLEVTRLYLLSGYLFPLFIIKFYYQSAGFTNKRD